MRSATFGDSHHAACVLVEVPEGEREAFCRSMMRMADFADRYVRRVGRLHAQWGNGTLRAVAEGYVRTTAKPSHDPVYGICFDIVSRTLRKGPKAKMCKFY